MENRIKALRKRIEALQNSKAGFYVQLLDGLYHIEENIIKEINQLPDNVKVEKFNVNLDHFFYLINEGEPVFISVLNVTDAKKRGILDEGYF